jgi:hypothetical protein
MCDLFPTAKILPVSGWQIKEKQGKFCQDLRAYKEATKIRLA